ncbi:MAG: hypothetical protein EAY75_08540 [Bacteroidetes bacterium]|nr:MAG: hypothetical protein EAY75_08540 [Bacteroidota bacterium]
MLVLKECKIKACGISKLKLNPFEDGTTAFSGLVQVAYVGALARKLAIPSGHFCHLPLYNVLSANFANHWKY